MEKKVTGCKDCPCLAAIESHDCFYCDLLDLKDNDVNSDSDYSPVTPDKCPLLKENVTLIFEK